MPVSRIMEALWHEFAAPLRSFVSRRAPREVDTEDVLQDVFLRIQEQLPRLRDADRIDAWIFQIARNVVADAFRRRTRQDALAAVDAPAPSDADDRAGEASLVGCLAAMIAALPDPYREAIELTELRGLTQAEAARQIGISLSGMKSRVQRGRERLKAIIHGSCRVETDVRGAVTECDPLRPSRCSSDSMGMQDKIETNANEISTSTPTTETASSGCCGGPAPQGASACCALDAEVKATGGAGCGCGTKAAAAPAKQGCC